MPVGRVGIERHVGDDHHLRQRLFHRPHRAQNQPVLVQLLRAFRILQLRVQLREKRHRLHPELPQRATLLHQVRDVQPILPGHRRDLLRRRFAIHHKKRRDEIRRAQRGLAHERAHGSDAAQTTRTMEQIKLEGGGRGHVYPRLKARHESARYTILHRLRPGGRHLANYGPARRRVSRSQTLPRRPFFP